MHKSSACITLTVLKSLKSFSLVIFAIPFNEQFRLAYSYFGKSLLIYSALLIPKEPQIDLKQHVHSSINQMLVLVVDLTFQIKLKRKTSANFCILKVECNT